MCFKPHLDGKRELTQEECYDKLGFSWSWYSKWGILSVIFLVQMSMNFNTSVYPNAVHSLSEEFGISGQTARVGQMIFLVLYALGCELWAPWSEKFGRWPVVQLSLFLVNIFRPSRSTCSTGRGLRSGPAAGSRRLSRRTGRSMVGIGPAANVAMRRYQAFLVSFWVAWVELVFFFFFSLLELRKGVGIVLLDTPVHMYRCLFCLATFYVAMSCYE